MDIHPTHIEVIARLSDPSILVVALLCAALLAYLLIRWLKYLTELRFRSTRDFAGLLTAIGLIVASFIGTGVLHMWLSWFFYKEYHGIGSGVTLLLRVPVYPVWLMGGLAVANFFGVKNLRKRKISLNIH
jgi:uncharacterized membrane protein